MRIHDLSEIAYPEAFALQKKIVSEKITNRDREDALLILEHPPVFTLGRRGGWENLTVSEKFLASKKIPVIETRRGGNITYHGPGQVVFYPIVDLEKQTTGVADFVTLLEEVMIETCKAFGVNAHRDTKGHGIWVNAKKIGSIGLAVKRGISFHGLALNVNIDLEPFSWINPCGMTDISMTSLKKELEGHPGNPICPDTAQVKRYLTRHFTNKFHGKKTA